MSTTFSFRRTQFDDLPPLPGTLVRSKSGKQILRIVKTTTFRRSGDPVRRDLIRMEVDKVPAAEVPDTIIGPWPIAPRPHPMPQVPQAAVEFHAAAARATAASTTPKSRKQRKRDLARAAQAHMADIESPVPAAQRLAVMSPDGSVFSPPKVTSSSWRDPDDMNVRSRAPKMVHGGYRRCDPLAVLVRSNSMITVEHLCASDFYRLAWELGPGGAIAGGREMFFVHRSFTPSMGPAEIRCQAMANWLWTQRQLSTPAKACLAAVVLDGQSVSSWAAARGGDRRYAIGYLTSVLDQLTVIYADDVRSRLRQEYIALD